MGTAIKVRCCIGCPCNHDEENAQPWWCAVLDRELSNAEMATEGCIPDWCPLRAGPVTVELAEGVGERW